MQKRRKNNRFFQQFTLEYPLKNQRGTRRDISSRTIEASRLRGTARTHENGNEWISGERPRLLEIATRYKLNAKFHRGFVVRRGTQFQIAAAFFFFFFFSLLSRYLITHACAPKRERGGRKMTWVRWHVVVQFIERIYKNWTCPDGRIPSNSVSAVSATFFLSPFFK